jgi:hypothetical protein
VSEVLTEMQRYRELAELELPAYAPGETLRAQILQMKDAISELIAANEAKHALLNTPEIHDFTQAVALEAAHQRQRWDDRDKEEYHWHGLITYLAAKCLLNPPQKDGTVGVPARMHRIVALAAAAANWHAQLVERGGSAAVPSGLGAVTCSKCKNETFIAEPHECVERPA